MLEVVFSREEFSDGTVLYNVDVEDVSTGMIEFSVPYSFDTVELAEAHAEKELFDLYGELKWRYSFLSSDDFAGAY